MKKIFFVALLVFQNACTVKLSDTYVVSSPDGSIDMTIKLKNGNLFYSIQKNKSQILDFSKLGLIANTFSFDSSIVLKSVRKKQRRTSWNQVWGEEKVIKDYHNEIFLQFSATLSAFQFY